MRSLHSLFAASVLAVSTLQAQDSLVFNQQYKGGHRYHQTITTEQEMDMDLGYKKVEQRMSMQLGMAVSVEDLEGAGGQRVTIAYDHTAMSQSAGGQKFSFDSKAPQAANAGPLAALGNIVGREFHVILDSDGAVKEVENYDATMQRLSAGNPNTADMYKKLFSKETVKKMMQQSQLRSGKAVKVGESWPFTSELVMPGIGKMVVSGSYTFAGMMEAEGRKLAKVDAKADITVEVGGADNEKTANLINQMKMKVEEGTMNGTLLYDPAIAFTRDISITQNVTLTAEVPDGSRKSIRLPMKQRVTVKLDEFSAPAPAPK